MKIALVVCGTGVATSTVVMGKVNEWLMKENLHEQVMLHQGNINDAISKWDDYDFVISTTIVPEKMEDKVINGVPLLTGIGVEEVYRMIKNRI
ncbi:PTS sugar transporter subunit IIB [Virgibacillus sp. FSP13]